MSGGALLWAPRAWISGRWVDAVLLHAGADGHWTDIDYGQRLLRRRRNVAALPCLHDGATAGRLFDRAQAGGGAAAGLPVWGLVHGARADLLVLGLQAPGLLGVQASHALDALVFATDARALRRGLGGRPVRGGRRRSCRRGRAGPGLQRRDGPTLGGIGFTRPAAAPAQRVCAPAAPARCARALVLSPAPP